ncbi:MAG: gliding motility-associated C-terminal domain-containing protein [Saprospiraceae bacterium]|nr:gliding motility-associated C-terminal domain-containing protein [Saprospiraceae bacterium]
MGGVERRQHPERCDDPNPVVNGGGTYTLTVTNNGNGGSQSDNTVVTENNTPPATEAGPLATITCASQLATLDGNGSSIGVDITYQWVASNGGNIVSGETTLTPVVNEGGTYTLTVTNNSNGCSQSDNTIVTENNTPPAAEAGTPATITCASPQATLDGAGSSTGTGITYLWTTTNGNIVSGATTLTPVVNGGGTYTLTVTNNGNGCSQSDNTIVTENNTPPAAEAGPPAAITCASQLATLDGAGSSTGAGITYLWTTTNGNIVSGATTLTPVVDEGGTYTLTVTDATGCTASDSATAMADASVPQVSGGLPDTLTCVQASVVLNGSFFNVSNPSFGWVGPNGYSNTTELTPTVSVAGTYVLTVTNTLNGCTASDNVTVTENSTPPAAVAGTPATITCASPQATLNGTGSSTGAGITYLWMTTNGNIVSGATTLTPVVSEGGTYTLTVTNNGNGCTALDDVMVTESNSPPVAVAGNPATITCASPQATLNGAGSSNGVGITYLWTTTNGNIVSGATTLIPVVSEGGTYTLTVTNTSNGCTASDSATVTANVSGPSIPAGGIGVTEANCFGTASGSITIQNATGGVPPYQYSINNGATFQASNIFVNLMSDTYFIAILDNAGCVSSSFPVIVNQPPALMSGTTNIAPSCSDPTSGSITLSVSGGILPYTFDWADLPGPSNVQNRTDLSAGTYTVTIVDGNACTALHSVTLTAPPNTLLVTPVSIAPATCTSGGSISMNTSGGTPNYQFNWSNGAIMEDPADLPPGTYTLTVTDANNCTATATATVPSDMAVPTADAVSAMGITCTTTTVTLDGSGSSSGVNFTYQWAGPGNITNGTTLTPTVGVAGTYTLTVTNTDNNCTASDVVTVGETILSLNASTTAANCFGASDGSVTLSASGSMVALSYSIDGGAFQPDSIFVGLAAGVYQAVVQDANQCSASQTVTVGQPTAISASLSQTDGGCTGSSGSVTVGSTSGGTSPYLYEWSNGANGTVISNLQAGSYTLTVTDGQGCEGTFTATVQPGQVESPVANDDEFSLQAGSLSLQGDLTQNDDLPQNWTLTVVELPAEGTLDYDGGSSGDFTWGSDSYVPMAAFTYEICAVDCPNLCDTATASISLELDEASVDEPDGFTPNGDGMNDEFIIPELEDPDAYPDNELTVFNRWGDVVYHANPYRNRDWDGGGLPAGTYFYIIRLNIAEGKLRMKQVVIIR